MANQRSISDEVYSMERLSQVRLWLTDLWPWRKGCGVWLIAFVSVAIAQTSLSGVVTDPNGAVYGSGTFAGPPYVEVEDKSSKTKIPLDEEGRFSVDLKPGTYTITAFAPHCYLYKRAPLHLSEGDRVFVRMIPRMRVLGIMLHADGTDTYTFGPRPKYESVAVSGVPIPLLIDYTGKKKKKKEFTEYGDAILTSGDWAIYAKAIRISKENDEITLLDWHRIVKGEQEVSSSDSSSLNFATDSLANDGIETLLANSLSKRRSGPD